MASSTALEGRLNSTAVRALPCDMAIEPNGALSILWTITRFPPLSRIVMTMSQLFLTASASAAAITFFAISKLIGGPYVGGGDGCCAPTFELMNTVAARMDKANKK